MSKKRRIVAATAPVPTTRPGEGVAIDAHVVVAPGGLSFGFSLDLTKARVPDRRYVADVCAVAKTHGVVKIMFGQERVDSQGWRTLLVIEMSLQAVNQFLAASNQMTGPQTLEEMVAVNGIEAEPISRSASEPSLPNQAASLVANLGLIAVANKEACIDFYHASAFALGAVQRSHKLSIEPVVRVDLRASLLLGFLAGLRALLTATL